MRAIHRPTPGPRLFRVYLLREEGAFFGDVVFFFLCPVCTDLVFNWFLLCVCTIGIAVSRDNAVPSLSSPSSERIPTCRSAYQASPPMRASKMTAPAQFGNQARAFVITWPTCCKPTENCSCQSARGGMELYASPTHSMLPPIRASKSPLARFVAVSVWRKGPS